MADLHVAQLLEKLIGEVQGLRADVQALQPAKVDSPQAAPEVRQAVVTGEAREAVPVTKSAAKRAPARGR